MCGINGIFDYSGVATLDGVPLVGKMNQAIAHRGPDDEGYWGDAGRRIHLGHRRLSILDLSPQGHQPMQSPLGNVTVFNGEIYNYQSLRKSFVGRTFRSTSDTEVLLALYDRDATDCLQQLNGMFAFAIWDSRLGQLVLACDQIGIKPLYYTDQGGVFAFASEVKALLELPWIRRELDEEAFYDFLTFNRLSPPRTMFRGIHKFPPGYRMVVGRRGIEKFEPYWKVSYKDLDRATDSELSGCVMKELRRSVHGQMISDVPVGAFLSGGVDSSAIVALMSEVATGPVRTYSIGFENAPQYDERVHAERIARLFNTEHSEKIVRRQDIVEHLTRLVDVFDEPLADATSIPIYFISQMARQNGTPVILTGDGSDEIFCGYRGWVRYQRLYPLFRALRGLPEPLRRLVAAGRHLFDESHPAYEMFVRAARGQEFFWAAGGIKESAKRNLLSETFRGRMRERNSHDVVRYYRRLFESEAPAWKQRDYRDWMSFLGLKEIVPNYYMYRADRLGMAHSIELRVPYLDRELVDLALSIPGRWKIRSGEPKYVLKRALEAMLPKDVLYRRKQGFCVPLHEWMKDILAGYVEQKLDRFTRETGLLDPKGVRALVKACHEGDRNVTFSLWNVYFLMAWYERWFGLA